jgi:calcineurin-like phosphoesterase family protein
MRVWPEQRRGAIQLYGHSHGRLPGTSLSIDVGVDCWNFMPVNLKQILGHIKELPDIDPEGDPELAGET